MLNNQYYIKNLLELSTKQEYLMNNGDIVVPIKIWNKRIKPSDYDLFFLGRNQNWKTKYYSIHDIICEIDHPSVYILRGGEKIFIINDNGEKVDIK